ncbi:MAG: PilZ domain-containing protein [Nitrospira sp.]|nr:PilZ domain-containing protein [Nitrospira sp.]
MSSQPLKSSSSAVSSEAAQQDLPKSSSHERRVQPRFTTQFRSTFSGQNREGRGRTLDMSSGGCKIESDMKVVQGATFECRLHVPGLDWPLRIDEATVRWVEGNTFGLAFTRISPEEVSKLEAVLKEIESEE